MNIEKDVMAIFQSNPGNLFEFSDLQKILGIEKKHRNELKETLQILDEMGKIHRFKHRKFGLLQSADLVPGTISIARKGFGFLRPEATTDGSAPISDIFIKSRNLGGALHGDRVLVRVTDRTDEKPEGRVIKVLKRARTEIVGRFHFERKGGMIVPRDSHINRLIQIPKLDHREKLKNGCWVMARIIDFSSGDSPMIGEIIDVVGMDEDKGIDILLVIRDYGIQPEFPEAVEAEAAAIPDAISNKELAGRTDLRPITTFTIDPETAKDFDDALSIERLPGGLYRLGVHIADVAHYVQPGSTIDDEAISRATSIYPVDRVIPMLPERLSNNMCSLRPNLDRLTMSVMMDIDQKGKVVHCEYHNAVIHSRFRLNYTEVQTVFDHSDPWICSKYASIREDLFALREVSEILIRMREEKGSLDLDVGETDVVFDSEGNVIDLRRHPRLASHRLVEQCMILANEMVAQKISKMHLPSLYRIHEPPSQDKLRLLAPILNNFGVTFPIKRAITPLQLQKVLAQTERLGEAGPILRRVILRAMMRAKYFPENKGHYGLGSACYTHFTSPIRRYPDLIVHRVLKSIISGEYKDAEKRKKWEDEMPEWAVHCSDMEGRAQEIEYEATNILGLEFMRRFLGHEFEGIISGVTNFGIFIELERYPIEGLIKVNEIGNDYYDFDPNTLTLRGKRSGRTFRIADKVRVMIDHIDVMKQEMDLSLVKTRSSRVNK